MTKEQMEECLECGHPLKEDHEIDKTYFVEVDLTDHEKEHLDVMHGGTSLPFQIRRKYARKPKLKPTHQLTCGCSYILITIHDKRDINFFNNIKRFKCEKCLKYLKIEVDD